MGRYTINIDGGRRWALLVGGYQSSSERVEMDDSEGEEFLESLEEGGEREVLMGGGGLEKEKALLDVMDGEHGEIPWRQEDGMLGGLDMVFWVDKAV